MTRRRGKRKRLTEAKVQRAITALVEILGCEDAQDAALRAGVTSLTSDVDRVCDALRKLQP